MLSDYRLVLSGQSVFREVEIGSSSALVRVGTGADCEVRFRHELFDEPFELELSRDRSARWTLTCVGDNLYLGTEDGRTPLVRRELAHGRPVEVRYLSTGAPLFSLTMSIDFEKSVGAYDRVIDTQGVDRLTLGRAGSDLVLNSAYTADDDIAIVRGQGGRLWIQDRRSAYGVYVDGRRVEGSAPLPDKTFFSVAEFHFYYDSEQLRCSSKASIRFNGVTFADEDPRVETSTYPLFTRNTRIKAVMDSEKIPILDPPNPPSPPQGNIVIMLLPVLIMLGMVVAMRVLMGNGSNMAYILMSMGMMGVGVVTSVFGFVSERRSYKRNCAKRVQSYHAYLDAKGADVEGFRQQELKVLDRRYPSLGDEVRMVQEFSGDLFDRSAGDDDFLDVRLGTGPRRSVKQVDFKPRERFESDELTDLPQRLYEKYFYVQGAPISVDLEANGALGVVGTDAQLYDVLKNMVIDVCCRHFATDVKVFFIARSANEPLVHWARNLPHVQNEELGRRNIVCDEESRNVLFEYLYKELADRQAARSKLRDAVLLPHFVIFVVDEVGLKNHPLSRFIATAEELGATFVFFEGYKEYLPQGCEQVVFLERDQRRGTLVEASNDRNASRFDYDHVDDFSAWMVAQTLAPVYSEEVSLEGTLTQSYSLFEMLRIMDADDLDLAARWDRSVVYRSMAAPIGLSKAGLVSLDLSDRADGPHGLVAGTTGSGKSETLLTYLVSLATLYHPYEVAFVIIDFKGGGMAYQLRDLPHLIGTITNIDGREIDRSLKSIRAELQKRQRLFAEAGVNHIDAYIRKYKAGEPLRPLPHLIIVVDEFAELKADQPEFMAELISAARIGRSLGVHLILATQKPAGQVNEQIWSNSRFKLCLKVQSREDSNEVLKSPLAAEIKEPGRAYLQVGNNERFELFQSAYSGGPEHQDAEDVHEFSVFEVANSGKRTCVYARRREKSDGLRTTQLDAVVAHVRAHCEHAGIAQLPSICLPPLPERIPYPGGTRQQAGYALGIYDDPDSQYQGPAVFDLDDANTFVVGTSQMGKTNLLETIVRAIAEANTPAEAAIYIMDFSSMILKNLEGLAHVGGVVLASEDEKLKNLFKLLGSEVADRKRKLLEVGVSSFSSYLEAGYTDLPHIYLIMDNFAVYRELYAERYETTFLNILSEGLSYGISVVVANSATQGFGYKYLSNFAQRIALSCNDTGEYGTVFDRCRMEPKAVPGRALCSFDKRVFEMQTYLGFEGEREIDRVRAMRAFVEERNLLAGGVRARRIPNVPDDLTPAYIAENYDVPLSQVAVALNYDTVAPEAIDLASQFQLALVGDRDGERAGFVRAFLSDIAAHALERPVELHIVDNLERGLVAYRDKPYVTRYYGDYSDVDLVVQHVSELLAERVAAVRERGLEAMEGEPYVVVVVNSADALKHISDTKATLSAFDRMSKGARGMRVFFLLAEVNDESVGFSSPALLKAIKESRKVVLFSNLGEQKFMDVTGMQARAFRTPLEPGQAYAFEGSDIAKIRVAR